MTTIEKKPVERYRKYPFTKLGVNDSFWMPGDSAKRRAAYVSAVKFSQLHHLGEWKFRSAMEVRRGKAGFRIERIA